MTELTATTPLVADEHDHATQDEPCTWCREEIGLCAYIRGVSGDVFHAEPCYREVTESLPIDAGAA